MDNSFKQLPQEGSASRDPSSSETPSPSYISDPVVQANLTSLIAQLPPKKTWAVHLQSLESNRLATDSDLEDLNAVHVQTALNNSSIPPTASDNVISPTASDNATLTSVSCNRPRSPQVSFNSTTPFFELGSSTSSSDFCHVTSASGRCNGISTTAPCIGTSRSGIPSPTDCESPSAAANATQDDVPGNEASSDSGDETSSDCGNSSSPFGFINLNGPTEFWDNDLLEDCEASTNLKDHEPSINSKNPEASTNSKNSKASFDHTHQPQQFPESQLPTGNTTRRTLKESPVLQCQIKPSRNCRRFLGPIESVSNLSFLGEHLFIRQTVLDKAFGCIIGSALGNTIGFGNPVTMMHGDDNKDLYQAASWTDGTDQAMLIIHSYIQNGEAFLKDFPERLQIWAEKVPIAQNRYPYNVGNYLNNIITHRDYLKDPVRIATKFWIAADRAPAENGSLVRTHPIGVMCIGFPQAYAFNLAAKVSLTTHADPCCTVSCCIFVGLIRGILRGEIESNKDVDEIIARAYYWVRAQPELVNPGRNPRLENQLDSLLNLESFVRYVNAKRLSDLELGSSGRNVYKCLGSAILLLRKAIHATRLSNPISPQLFEILIRELIMEGGDAETNAAVAGALLGAWLGYSNLPRYSTLELKARDFLKSKTKHFFRQIGILPTNTVGLLVDDGWTVVGKDQKERSRTEKILKWIYPPQQKEDGKGHHDSDDEWESAASELDPRDHEPTCKLDTQELGEMVRELEAFDQETLDHKTLDHKTLDQKKLARKKYLRKEEMASELRTLELKRIDEFKRLEQKIHNDKVNRALENGREMKALKHKRRDKLEILKKKMHNEKLFKALKNNREMKILRHGRFGELESLKQKMRDEMNTLKRKKLDELRAFEEKGLDQLETQRKNGRDENEMKALEQKRWDEVMTRVEENGRELKAFENKMLNEQKILEQKSRDEMNTLELQKLDELEALEQKDRDELKILERKMREETNTLEQQKIDDVEALEQKARDELETLDQKRRDEIYTRFEKMHLELKALYPELLREGKTQENGRIELRAREMSRELHALDQENVRKKNTRVQEMQRELRKLDGERKEIRVKEMSRELDALKQDQLSKRDIRVQEMIREQEVSRLLISILTS